MAAIVGGMEGRSRQIQSGQGFSPLRIYDRRLLFFRGNKHNVGHSNLRNTVEFECRLIPVVEIYCKGWIGQSELRLVWQMALSAAPANAFGRVLGHDRSRQGTALARRIVR